MPDQEKQKDIGGVWIRQTSKGDDMLSIQVEINGTKQNFVAFVNGYKTKSNQPDYKIYPAYQRQ